MVTTDHNHRDHAHVMKFHELRIDHKLVNAESQLNVDFRTRKANKRAKEDLRRVPECKSRPNSSGMKQWFQLRASRSDCCDFYTKGGGIYRKSGTVRIVLSNIEP